MEKNHGLCRSAGWLALAVVTLASGCGLIESEPIKVLRASGAAYNNLADALAGVRDAQSAEASLTLVEQRYGELFELVKKISENQSLYKSARASKITIDAITADIQRGTQRFAQEVERLNHTPGLPTAFWKIVKKSSFDLLESTIGSGLIAMPGATSAFLHEARGFYQQYPFEEIVNVELKSVYGQNSESVIEKLSKLAPGARTCHLSVPGAEDVFLAPVKDFRGFVRRLDLGRITYQDESRRVVEIEVSMEKVPNPDVERISREHDARLQEIKDRQAAQREKMAEERAARERERKGPDPSEPDYYEQMAARMVSGNSLHQNQAIDAMLQVEPEDVKSPEARKKLARAFKTLAEGNHIRHRKEIVEALVKWGGVYSVPILLQMIDRSYSPEEETVLRLLAEMKVARAAPAFVKRLGDSHYHELAYNGLIAMGSDAEDAVLLAAQSDDRDVTIAVIKLLGEIGTNKSRDFLRRVQQGRDRELRLLSMTSAQKINKRVTAPKPKSRDT